MRIICLKLEILTEKKNRFLFQDDEGEKKLINKFQQFTLFISMSKYETSSLTNKFFMTKFQ